MFCLIDFINHAIDRQYMFGVARDRKRVKATAEVFTPSGLVQEQFRWIVEKNIRCENALTYDFSFE